MGGEQGKRREREKDKRQKEVKAAGALEGGGESRKGGAGRAAIGAVLGLVQMFRLGL